MTKEPDYIPTTKELYQRQVKGWRTVAIILFLGLLAQLVVNAVIVTLFDNTVKQVDCNNRHAIQELIDQVSTPEDNITIITARCEGEGYEEVPIKNPGESG